MAMSDVIQPGTSGSVQVAYEDEIAVFRLSHAGRLNAITASMSQELAGIATARSPDESLRCVVLRGDGGTGAAGGDISAFPRLRADLAGVRHSRTQILAP